MELVNIEKLLKKYEKSKTTLQEEKILQKYFSSKNIAIHLQSYKIMFNYFEQSRAETYTKPIKLKKKKSFRWKQMAVIAIILLTTVFIGNYEYKKNQQKKQFVQVKETLQLLSVNLNRGNRELYEVSKNINKSDKAVEHLYTYKNTVRKIINNINTKKEKIKYKQK